MTAIGNGLQGCGHLAMVSHGTIDRVAPGKEFFNITTGGKRQITITTQNQAPDIIVRRKRCDRCGETLPHSEVERIELARIGQGQRRNGTLTRAGNRTGHCSDGGMHVALGQCLSSGQQMFVHRLFGTFGVTLLDRRHDRAVLDQRLLQTPFDGQ